MLVSLQDLIEGARCQGASIIINDIIERVTSSAVSKYEDCKCFDDLPEDAKYVFRELDRAVADEGRIINRTIDKLQKTIPQFDTSGIQVEIPSSNIAKNDDVEIEIKNALDDLEAMIHSIIDEEELHD